MDATQLDNAGEAERLAYVFGGDADPDEWFGADEDERFELVRRRFGSLNGVQLALRVTVIGLLTADDPAELWPTVQRLDDEGLAVDAVLNQLTIVFTQTLQETGGLGESAQDPVQAETPRGAKTPVGTETPPDADHQATFKSAFETAFVARLARLPLPDGHALEGALVDVARDGAVIDEDELLDRAVARFEEWSADPLLAHLAEHTLDHVLQDEDGPLVGLPGDRVAHAHRLRDGVVLTHVLTDAERTAGTLTVSFDLAAFARIPEPRFDDEPLDRISAEPGHLAELGGDCSLPAAADGTIEIEPLPDTPPVENDLVAALQRSYDETADEPELPVAGEDLLFGMLAEDREAFAEPRAPLQALCDTAGLEQRGSEVAHDPTLWTNQRLVHRIGRIYDAAGDDDAARDALEVLGVAERAAAGEAVESARARQVLEMLDDVDVLTTVCDELFDFDPWPDYAEAADRLAAVLVDAAGSNGERATARYVAALAAEADGDPAAAEQHLALAVEADGDNVLALDRLAWYASDRGDAAQAARLWRRCPPGRFAAEDLATVEPFARAPKAELGRNERCWCGSGRKYKQCHLGVAERAPLADRVGWLCRKAVGYVNRSGPEGRHAVAEVVTARVSDPEDDDQILRAFDDPIVYDLVLTEGGWFNRFLAARSSLLPDDEALLAASWTMIDRTVYEITAVTPGVGLAVRDLRTGDNLDIRERTFPQQARLGMLVCARAVPDGETHQFVGAVFPVKPGRESQLLDLLDEGDPYEIAAWVGAAERPPLLRTREGEPLVECEVVVATEDVAGLTAHLDDVYERNAAPAGSADTAEGKGRRSWTEHFDLNENEAVIRATLELDGDQLTITTNSEERADRILGRLHDVLDDVTVLADTRTPLDAANLHATRRGGLPDLSNVPDPVTIPDKAIAEIQDQMERRWCDEQIPALDGLTPREAAADPTRREQLERLLASFETTDTPPGGFTIRPSPSKCIRRSTVLPRRALYPRSRVCYAAAMSCCRTIYSKASTLSAPETSARFGPASSRKIYHT